MRASLERGRSCSFPDNANDWDVRNQRIVLSAIDLLGYASTTPAHHAIPRQIARAPDLLDASNFSQAALRAVQEKLQNATEIVPQAVRRMQRDDITHRQSAVERVPAGRYVAVADQDRAVCRCSRRRAYLGSLNRRL